MPVFVFAPNDQYFDKVVSNIEQVRARNGKMIAVCSNQSETIKHLVDDYIESPSLSSNILQTIVNSIPLQLFAYFMAVYRGTDVDQPRNLAKSVTVE